ncbi:hypothetical protein BDV26DRAFT_290345 [Aspergillus bertholletiae]|uniref:Uncharacterized protein n=1 Tax=Aspergillus bertholletiae TaxID=1226010 RepID=A0A5N7BFD2_9EURO|nr:hypothetical protein BDV26DRAFT_290345 [Aspergillus bertholletiae]
MIPPSLFKASLILLPLILVFLLFEAYNSRWDAFRIQKSLCGMLDHEKPGTTLREFTRRPSIEDLSHEGDNAWNTELFTPHGGFLIVRRNETTKEKWGVSMFHGLHCLQIIRSMLQQARENGMSSMAGGHGDHHQQHSDHLDETHVEHCFSYIAQSLMCSADDTIEPPQEHYDSDGNLIDINVDGMGHIHRCRDSRRIWEVVQQSEQSPIDKWDWEINDTVESVFGSH